MCEAILSLIGVLIGGILTLLATWFSDRLRKKDERRKKELEVLNITMSHYFSLLDKLKNESYWNHHLEDFIDFYYNSFSKMRSNNKSNEIILIKSMITFINGFDMRKRKACVICQNYIKS